MAKKASENGQDELPQPHKNAACAITAVMAEIDFIKKRDPQPGGGLKYAYAAEADIVGELHPLFVKHGLCIVPYDWDILHNEIYHTDNGKQMSMVRVRGRYAICHGESGTDVKVSGLGEASDVSDKAAAKAQTIAYKYALRQAFLLETGTDPDKEQNKDRGSAAAQQPKGQQRAADDKKERFEKCRQSIAVAESEKHLEAYKKAYKKMGLTDEEVKVLDAACDARKKELSEKKDQKTTPETSNEPPSDSEEPVI
jgi:hypothetical protein